MTASRECRRGIRCRGAADRAGAQRCGAVFERYRAGGPAADRGCEGYQSTIKGQVIISIAIMDGVSGQGCGTAGEVHRLAHYTTCATRKVCITTVNGGDIVTASRECRRRIRSLGSADGPCAQRCGAVYECHRAGGPTADRGGKRHGTTIGAGVSRTGQGCGTATGIHRLAHRVARAGTVVIITAVNGRDPMATN